jgi:dihydroorotase
MMAIREAVANGVVDCIASHHHPLHWDEKNCEFEYAKNGMETFESVFGALHTVSKSLDTLIEQLTTRPRKLLGLSEPAIEEGSAACFTFFNPSEQYVFDAAMIQSASSNNAFIGKALTGKVLGILHKSQLVLTA